LRDIHLTSRREFEIPEYSRKDCEVAYSQQVDDRRTNTGRFHLLSIGGRLFRGLGPLQEALDEHFSNPFSSTIDKQYGNLGINVLFEGRLRLQQQLGLRSRKTWPRPVADVDSRNETFLEDLIGSLMDISAAEYGEALLTTARVGMGLAVVDGALWCETPEPCLVVCINEWLPGQHQVFRYADFASDIPSFHYGVSTRRFQIEDIEGSAAYMRELVEMTGKERNPADNPTPLDVIRHARLADFNDGYEHIRRISRDLSHACVTTAYRKPELADTLTDDQHELLERCKAALLGENQLLGERFDVVDGALDLLEIWRELGRPKPGEVLQLTPAKLLDRYLEKTLEDAAPVNFMPRAAPLAPRS
jgi:hypothetical protein